MANLVELPGRQGIPDAGHVKDFLTTRNKASAWQDEVEISSGISKADNVKCAPASAYLANGSAFGGTVEEECRLFPSTHPGGIRMSMDSEHDRSETASNEQESPMFAARPIWEERGRKRRGLGRKAAPAAPAATISPEPRTFASERDYDEPMALDTPVDSPRDRSIADPAMDQPMTGRVEAARADAYAGAGYMAGNAPRPSDMPEEADSGLIAPIGRASTRADRAPKSRGMGPAAIAAGVVALGAIGAVGWYASRDNDGIPEIAPGGPTTSEVAALPPVDLPPNPPVADTAVNPPAAAAATPPRQTVRAAAPVRTAQARTRPAAPSAADTAVNASATLPAGPQPYSTLNPGATAPAPVEPTVTPTPPTQAAPPPAESPAEIPATPPTLPSETTPPTDPAPEITPPTS